MRQKLEDPVFSLLVENSAYGVPFEPLNSKDVSQGFEYLASELVAHLPQDPPTLETYQRHHVAPAAPPRGHVQKTAINDREILDLRARLSAKEAELEEIKAQHLREIASVKETSAEEYSNLFESALTALESRIANSLYFEVSTILSPFLNKKMSDGILEEFAVSLRKCMRDGEFFQISIKSPKDKIDALKNKFRQSENLRFIESDSLEVYTEVNSQILSTRFEYWGNLLGGGTRNE